MFVRHLGVGALFMAMIAGMGTLGCPAAPPAPPPLVAAPAAPPPAAIAPTVAARPSASAPTAAAAPKTPVTAPTIPTLEDAERSELPTSLAAVKKSFDEKFYSDAADLLEVEAKKNGPVEYEVLVYALLGHARNMTNEVPVATRNYRRVLAKWGPFYKAGRKLSKGTPEEKKRYNLGLEAFGESLFFLAERKRIKLDDLLVPSYEKEDTPAMAKAFADGKLAGYLARSATVIKAAQREFDKVLNLRPVPPKRWAVAAHSRVGAMYGIVAENVRNVNVKKENRKPIDDKGAPFLARAKEAYQACKNAAGAEATSFSKSCDDWLKAHP